VPGGQDRPGQRAGASGGGRAGEDVNFIKGMNYE